MSNYVRPHSQPPTRLLCPWDSPGKNTGVGCHFLLQCMKVKSEIEVTQSCLTLRDPMDCSLPGSSIHGIFQAQYWSGVHRLLLLVSIGLLKMTYLEFSHEYHKLKKIHYNCNVSALSLADSKCLAVSCSLFLQLSERTAVVLHGIYLTV